MTDEHVSPSFCSQCGASVKDARFCASCGQPQVAPSEPEPEARAASASAGAPAAARFALRVWMPETKPAWLVRRQTKAQGPALAHYMLALIALHLVLGFVFTPKVVTMAAIAAVALWGFSRVAEPTVRTVAAFVGVNLVFVLLLPSIVWLTNTMLGWPSPRVHWEMVTISGLAHYAGYAVLGMAVVGYHDPELRGRLRDWVGHGSRALDPARAAVGLAAAACAVVGLSLALTGGSFHFARSFTTQLNASVSQQYGYKVTGCEVGDKIDGSRFVECDGGISAVLGPDMRVSVGD